MPSWLIQDKHVNAVKFSHFCLGWAFEVATQKHKDNQQRLSVWDSEWMFLSMEGGRWEKLNGRHQIRKGKCLGSGVYQCVFFFPQNFELLFRFHAGNGSSVCQRLTLQRAGSEKEEDRQNEREEEVKKEKRVREDRNERQKWFLNTESLKVKTSLKSGKKIEGEKEWVAEWWWGYKKQRQKPQPLPLHWMPH